MWGEQARQIDPTGKSFLIFRKRVKPRNQKESKIFRFSQPPNHSTSIGIPSRYEGRFAIVISAGWDAVDADVPLTSGAEAYGEDVWS